MKYCTFVSVPPLGTSVNRYNLHLQHSALLRTYATVLTVACTLPLHQAAYRLFFCVVTMLMLTKVPTSERSRNDEKVYHSILVSAILYIVKRNLSPC